MKQVSKNRELVYLQSLRDTGILKELMNIGVISYVLLARVDIVERFDILRVTGYRSLDAARACAEEFDTSIREVYRALKKINYEDRFGSSNTRKEKVS